MRVRALALLYALVVSTSFCFAGDVVTRFRDNSDYGDGTNWATVATFGSITTGGQCGSSIFTDSTGSATCWVLRDSATDSPAYLVLFTSSVSNIDVTYSGLADGTSDYGLLTCGSFSTLPCLDGSAPSGFFQDSGNSFSSTSLILGINNFVAPSDVCTAINSSTASCEAAVYAVVPKVTLDPNGDPVYDVPTIDVTNFTPTPEPGSLILLGSGALSLLGLRRRKK